MKDLWTVIQGTLQEFGRAQPAELAGAISYFAILSLAPILVLTVSVAGLIFGPASAETQIANQLRLLVGEQVSEALSILFAQNEAVQSGGGVGVIGLATLIIGATGLFTQVQRALNRIWGVRPKPNRNLLAILRGRGVGFLIALLLGALLAVLVLVDGIIVALGDLVNQQFAVPGVGFAVRSAETALSFAMLMVLFAIVFRTLPDAIIKWRDVWVGAGVTTLLFSLGQVGIGLYLSQNTLASAFGAAGSVIVLLLWIYFSAMVFLFGAQVTRVYARRFGDQIEPKPYALRVPAVADVVENEHTSS